MTTKIIKDNAKNYLDTLNPKSIKRIKYGYIINNFITFLTNKKTRIPKMIHIEQFLSSKINKTKRPSNSYHNLRLAAIRDLFNYLIKHNLVKKNPTQYIKSQPTQQQHSHRTLTINELKYILNHTSQDTHDAIYIITHTGLRIKELCSIRQSNIKKYKQQELTIHTININTKGNKLRRIAINQHTLNIINKRFNKYKYLANTPLFPAKFNHGHTTSPNTLYNKIKKELRSIGFPNVTPHWFRHTFAQQLQLQNTPTHHIQQSLGHSNLNTTQRYLQQLKIIPNTINLNLTPKTYPNHDPHHHHQPSSK